MNISQRAALQEAGFAEAQTNALVMALEPLATKEDLAGLRKDHEVFRGELAGVREDLAVIRNDLRWMKWVGGAIGIAVLTELVSGSFS